MPVETVRVFRVRISRRPCPRPVSRVASGTARQGRPANCWCRLVPWPTLLWSWLGPVSQSPIAAVGRSGSSACSRRRIIVSDGLRSGLIPKASMVAAGTSSIHSRSPWRNGSRPHGADRRADYDRQPVPHAAAGWWIRAWLTSDGSTRPREPRRSSETVMPALLPPARARLCQLPQAGHSTTLPGPWASTWPWRWCTAWASRWWGWCTARRTSPGSALTPAPSSSATRSRAASGSPKKPERQARLRLGTPLRPRNREAELLTPRTD